MERLDTLRTVAVIADGVGHCTPGRPTADKSLLNASVQRVRDVAIE
jgi:hypothetical protein